MREERDWLIFLSLAHQLIQLRNSLIWLSSRRFEKELRTQFLYRFPPKLPSGGISPKPRRGIISLKIKHLFDVSFQNHLAPKLFIEMQVIGPAFFLQTSFFEATVGVDSYLLIQLMNRRKT